MLNSEILKLVFISLSREDRFVREKLKEGCPCGTSMLTSHSVSSDVLAFTNTLLFLKKSGASTLSLPFFISGGIGDSVWCHLWLQSPLPWGIRCQQAKNMGSCYGNRSGIPMKEGQLGKNRWDIWLCLKIKESLKSSDFLKFDVLRLVSPQWKCQYPDRGAT